MSTTREATWQGASSTQPLGTWVDSLFDDAMERARTPSVDDTPRPTPKDLRKSAVRIKPTDFLNARRQPTTPADMTAARPQRVVHRPLLPKLPAEPSNYKVSELKLVRALCKSSFYEFVKEMWDVVVQEKPIWNWHVRYLCNEAQRMVEKVIAGEPKDYDEVVNISPGSTKSLIYSVFLPAWVWIRKPSLKFLGVSYAFTLAQELSKKCRDIVTSEKYQKCFPEIKLREDQNTKAFFQNTLGGIRYAAGLDGTVTGFHFHIIVIDDPLNPKQATSVADLKHANDWIKHTLSSRKVDRRITVTILVMQRLHQDDPTANFLKKKRVHHICLPAEETPDITPPSLRAKYVDGLMDPTRLDRTALAEAREEGEYHYAAQYLQTPVPESGGMFKVGKLIEAVPGKIVRRVRYWDKAGTLGGGAYTCGILMGMDEDGRYWILDVVRVQLDSYQRERLIRATAVEDGRPVKVGVEEEGGSGGIESAANTVRTLAGFRVKTYKVNKSDGSKARRADPFSAQVNGGNVYLLQGEDWIKELVEEMKYFPHSKYKDQVDACSGAFGMLFKKRIKIGGMNV